MSSSRHNKISHLCHANRRRSTRGRDPVQAHVLHQLWNNRLGSKQGPGRRLHHTQSLSQPKKLRENCNVLLQHKPRRLRPLWQQAKKPERPGSSYVSCWLMGHCCCRRYRSWNCLRLTLQWQPHPVQQMLQLQQSVLLAPTAARSAQILHGILRPLISAAQQSAPLAAQSPLAPAHHQTNKRDRLLAVLVCTRYLLSHPLDCLGMAVVCTPCLELHAQAQCQGLCHLRWPSHQSAQRGVQTRIRNLCSTRDSNDL